MKQLQIFLVLLAFMFFLTTDIHPQQAINTNNKQPELIDQQLNAKEQAIVTISAFTAQGDMVQLEKVLNTGLDLGLSINEIKEVLIQLYAYAGFPRSLNALHALLDVLEERKGKGISDVLGKEPNALPLNIEKRQLGTELQTKLVGKPVEGEVYQFAPAIDQFLKEHLFCDIFGRDNLDWKTREIATISALAALTGTENQLYSHFGVGMYNGITVGQLNHLVTIIQSRVGKKEGTAAEQVLQRVLKQTGE